MSDLSSYLEGLLNLMCTQLFLISLGSPSTKRDTFYVKWQSETSYDEKKHLKIPSQLTEQVRLQFKTFNSRN